MYKKWSRIDEPGMEFFEMEEVNDGFRVVSSIVNNGTVPFGLYYVWKLDKQWRTRQLYLRVNGIDEREMTIERAKDGWLVNNKYRSDLRYCDEIDLSATPFCNSLAIKSLGGTGNFLTLYVDVPSLKLSVSEQRYEYISNNQWRYIDKGIAKGFEANIVVDEQLLVNKYENLFESIQ